MTTFVRLNHGWNADPNAPRPHVAVDGSDVLLTFYVNAFAYPEFVEGSEVVLRFEDCQRYRLGETNDEGWYMGQCRFGRLAPDWGEFYAVEGDPHLLLAPSDWVNVTGAACPVARRHYLFYLKDETFECVAGNWRVQLPANTSLEATPVGEPLAAAQLQRYAP
jgi:hypothetical protein